jgi:hypothetical protein
LERIGGGVAKTTADTSPSGKSTIECPPSKDSLGRASWTLLHNMVCISLPTY